MVAPTDSFLFELCATSLRAVQAAQTAGAHRVELCVNLNEGGTTPPTTLITAAVRAVRIPIYVLIRPRAGNFVYSDAEFARMREEVILSREAGAAGVVLGVLHGDGTVDVKRTRELVELARPMSVTFHRAVDESVEIGAALEAAIDAGADCVLTSGGKQNVTLGAEQLARLTQQAAGRIGILAGGGLKLATLRQLLQTTCVRMVHGSLGIQLESGTEEELAERQLLLEAKIRTTVGILREQYAPEPVARLG